MDPDQLAINGGPQAITMDPQEVTDLLKWPRYEPSVIDRCAELTRRGDVAYNQELVFSLGDAGTSKCLPLRRT
ncbi:MAG TPA: hypothetical protein VKK79_24255 [Candidatus Lokiarchaeia archaeon]|nr:hypothetical protein [Candidatus Lokiarchaeia archaeon]